MEDTSGGSERSERSERSNRSGGGGVSDRSIGGSDRSGGVATTAA